MKTIQFYNHKNIVSKKLREAREALNISQNELASKLQVLGVSIDQQAISKIERDLRIVTDYELICLCKILKMDEKALLGDGYKLISEP